MADDLDDLLRRAMKSLDDQVPSGYFEDLPGRTLARLDGSGDERMETSSTDREAETSSGAPPREEDSGLHDIKNLAQTTKQRLSSQKIPARSDDDVLASSSAGWKAVALPAPASAVSLPAIDERPSKRELKKRAEGSVATAVPLPEQATPIGARIAATQKRRSKGPAIAIVGAAVAAAAGAVIFVAVRDNDAERAPAAMESKQAGPAPAVSAPAFVPAAKADQALAKDANQLHQAAAIATDTPLDAGVAAAAAGSGAPVDEGAAKVEPAPQKFAKPPIKKSVDKAKSSKKPEPDKPVKDKKDKIEDGSKKQPVSETKKPASGDPNFDDLLKEAGVNQKKDDKPKLDKKELTKDDFTRGIGAVAGAAGKCYQGKQGTAAVKIVIAPNGRVQKVTVTGEFAGTPVASCVTSAVKGASFPPWDGSPQSFNYSFLLSE